MIALSMHQLTIQLPIVQRNINLPNHDLVSLIQHKQQYIYCKLLNNFSISIRTACKSFHNISAHNWALNQSTYSSTNNCSKKYQLPNHDLANLLHVKQNYI